MVGASNLPPANYHTSFLLRLIKQQQLKKHINCTAPHQRRLQRACRRKGFDSAAAKSFLCCPRDSYYALVQSIIINGALFQLRRQANVLMSTKGQRWRDAKVKKWHFCKPLFNSFLRKRERGKKKNRISLIPLRKSEREGWGKKAQIVCCTSISSRKAH